MGSDAGVIPHGSNGKELLYLVEAGMTPAAAIEAATINAADLLELSDQIGTIEPGKIADIIATAHSPLEDIGSLLKIGFVMRNGVVVKNEFTVPVKPGGSSVSANSDD
jgi:imidazolonepropionase-like amidohydrolase